jgi:hypothetical protein
MLCVAILRLQRALGFTVRCSFIPLHLRRAHSASRGFETPACSVSLDARRQATIASFSLPVI